MIRLRNLSKSYDGRSVLRNLDLHVASGDAVRDGDAVATVVGAARRLLECERVALNFLQRLSGVATLARAYVDAVAGTGVRILDTRKTLPGWRVLDKYATAVGGAVNHRVGLFDGILLKDNHVALAGGVAAAWFLATLASLLVARIVMLWLVAVS